MNIGWREEWVIDGWRKRARRINGRMEKVEEGMDRLMERLEKRMGESLPFAMAYRMAMLLVFRPLPTLRMGLFLVIISHTTMAKLKISQRSV